MASSAKTKDLGLSLWEPGDVPERLDFRQDNEALERILAAHIKSTAVHMTTAEKAFLSRPTYNFVYTGDGNSSKVVTWSNSSVRNPRFLFVFPWGGSPIKMENGILYYEFGFGGWSPGSIDGIAVGINNITVKNSSPEEDAARGVGYRLNRAGVTYSVTIFP